MDSRRHFLVCSLTSPGLRWVHLSLSVPAEVGNIVRFVLKAQTVQLGSLFGQVDLVVAGKGEVVGLDRILALAEMTLLAVAVAAVVAAAAVVVVVVAAAAVGIETVVGNYSVRSQAVRSTAEGGISRSCERHTSHSR